MYKLCKTEQSAQRQRLLEEGLLAAMLTQPYEDISISDLCDRMEIPRKSFYRYFTGKDGALQALLDHRLMEYQIWSQSRENLGSLLDLCCFFDFWRSQKPLLDALAKSGLSGLLVQRAISKSTEERFPVFDERSDSRHYQEHVISFVVCGLMSMVIQWHHDGYRQSVKEMAGMTHRILSAPLIRQDPELYP
jgi:AcrR family transcriptional regulator